MKVSIIGQAAFGEAAFRRLRETGSEVVAVSAPPGDRRPDALWQAAADAGIDPVPTAQLKDTAILERWRSAGAELCVMAFVTDILPEDVFSAPARGTIQYHPSLLPIHRGSSAMNWPIIFGETETGLTVFWPDKGIDTGPVLLQKHTPIGPDDTMGSLYFDRLFPMGVDALAEAVALVEAGTAPRTNQDHPHSTYEPPCRDEYVRIGWYEPARRVYDLIRGCNPSPGAWTMFQGAKLKLFDCHLLEELRPGMPGRVLAIGDDGVDVRLNGGTLRLQRVQPEGGAKLSAGEWARSAGLREGFRFR